MPGSDDDWPARAKCRFSPDPDAWTRGRKPGPRHQNNARGSREEQQRAKTMCRGCEVIRQCAQFALDTRATHFIYGGVQLYSSGENAATYRVLKRVASS